MTLLLRLLATASLAFSMAACTSDTDDDDTPDAGDTPDTGEQDTGVADMGTVMTKCDPPSAPLP